MSTLGIIARADDGGLGAQTWEMWRHLQPERTLVVLCDHNTRGSADPERYRGGMGEVRFCHQPSRDDASWLAQVDTIWSAETFYSRHVHGYAQARGVRRVLHANPEMHDQHEQAEVFYAATPWRLDLLPDGTEVLPFPVALDLDGARVYADRLVPVVHHVSSNAMEDRNGTELLLAALEHCRSEFDVMITGGYTGHRPSSETVHGHLVWRQGHCHAMYWQCWPALGERDVFVLPRRYGGLCLPIQEAQARGLPVVCLDSDPYRNHDSVPSSSSSRVRMKGGYVDVHRCDPRHLAVRIDQVIDNVHRVADAARRWSELEAKRRSWDQLLPLYQALLRP